MSEIGGVRRSAGNEDGGYIDAGNDNAADGGGVGDATAGDAMAGGGDAAAVGAGERGGATRPTTRRKAAVRGKKVKGGKRKAVRANTRWSAKREELFLAALAETSNVAGSIRAAGLAETTVYRRRQHYAEFRAKWAAALREGYLKLESEMLGRALNGVEKAVWHGGQQVGTVTEYNDRTALALLTAHRATVLGTGAAVVGTSIEELRAGLKRRMAEMNERMGGAG